MYRGLGAKVLKPNDEGMALATCRICPTWPNEIKKRNLQCDTEPRYVLEHSVGSSRAISPHFIQSLVSFVTR